MPHPASTINLEVSSLSTAQQQPSTGAAAVGPGQVAAPQDAAVKGGIAQAKGGSLAMHGRAAAAADHTLQRLQECLGILLPLQVELPSA